MNLKHLSDDQLIKSTHRACKEERESTLKVLYHLKEIEARSLYLKLGYSKPIEYCIKELKYSETAAYRRIQAMQLLKALPQVAKKIESGSLNLNQLSKAQSFFQKSKKELKVIKSTVEKADILKKLENKSIRETEKTLFSIEPQISLRPKESLRAISSTESELKVTLDQDTHNNLETLRIHFGGRKTLSEIVSLLASEKVDALKKKRMREDEKLNKVSNTSLQKPDVLTFDLSNEQNSLHQNDPDHERKAAPATVQTLRSRHIPNEIKRLVMKRANHTCEYKSPITNQKCISKLYLEFDHKQEYAKGGAHTPDNLQVLCWQHHNLKTKGG